MLVETSVRLSRTAYLFIKNVSIPRMHRYFQDIMKTVGSTALARYVCRFDSHGNGWGTKNETLFPLTSPACG